MKDTTKKNKNQQPFRSEARRRKVEAAKKRAMEKQKQAKQHAGENPEIEKQIDSAMEKIIKVHAFCEIPERCYQRKT